MKPSSSPISALRAINRQDHSPGWNHSLNHICESLRSLFWKGTDCPFRISWRTSQVAEHPLIRIVPLQEKFRSLSQGLGRFLPELLTPICRTWVTKALLRCEFSNWGHSWWTILCWLFKQCLRRFLLTHSGRPGTKVTRTLSLGGLKDNFFSIDTKFQRVISYIFIKFIFI